MSSLEIKQLSNGIPHPNYDKYSSVWSETKGIVLRIYYIDK